MEEIVNKIITTQEIMTEKIIKLNDKLNAITTNDIEDDALPHFLITAEGFILASSDKENFYTSGFLYQPALILVSTSPSYYMSQISSIKTTTEYEQQIIINPISYYTNNSTLYSKPTTTPFILQLNDEFKLEISVVSAKTSLYRSHPNMFNGIVLRDLNNTRILLPYTKLGLSLSSMSFITYMNHSFKVLYKPNTTYKLDITHYVK